MKIYRTCLSLLLFCISSLVNAQSHWLHVSGISWHDQPGYNNRNPGIGLETQVKDRWSVAVGTYYNSFRQTTWYAAGKYQWYDRHSWRVNLNLGAATGYNTFPVTPLVLPEVCYAWICVFAIPRVSADTTTMGAIYLRIPIEVGYPNK